MNPKTDPIEQMRFDRNFNPAKYHSITDVGFSGPDGTPDEEDKRILSEVHSALLENTQVRNANVLVNVLAGAVTLMGRVSDTRSIQSIEARVARIKGVKEIHNQIERQ